ncbi:hypothetical protein TDB9533_02442 [Thalassocella blandensis]|nr:hypothetical protein TDB9533_02442 [Thalassocella blandensis]
MCKTRLQVSSRSLSSVGESENEKKTETKQTKSSFSSRVGMMKSKFKPKKNREVPPPKSLVKEQRLTGKQPDSKNLQPSKNASKSTEEMIEAYKSESHYVDNSLHSGEEQTRDRRISSVSEAASNVAHYGEDAIENLKEFDSVDMALFEKLDIFYESATDTKVKEGLNKVNKHQAEDKGRSNSQSTAKTLSILRSVGANLEEFGLDGKNALASGNKKNKSKVKISEVWEAIKNTAKVTSNIFKHAKAKNSSEEIKESVDNTIQTSSAPSALEVSASTASVIEYTAGIKLSYDKIRNAKEKDSKAEKLFGQIQQDLASAEALATEKSAKMVALDKCREGSDKYKLLHLEIQSCSQQLHKLSVVILGRQQQLAQLKSDSTTDDRIKIYRYCVSSAGMALTLAAKIIPGGDVAAGVLSAGYTSTAIGQTIATGLEGKSTAQSVGKDFKLMKFTDGVQAFAKRQIKSIEVKEIELRSTTQQLTQELETLQANDMELWRKVDNAVSSGDLHSEVIPEEIRALIVKQGESMMALVNMRRELAFSLMVLGKQPSKLEAILKNAGKTANLLGYGAGTITAGASFAVLAGAGGAAGVVLVAGPVGWTLAGIGAAVPLGLAAKKGVVCYAHHWKLKGKINQAIGRDKQSRKEIAKAKEDDGMGKAHEVLIDKQVHAHELPGISSRAGVTNVFDELLHDFNEIYDDEFEPQIEVLANEGEEPFEFSLKNPLADMPKYQKIKNNSSTCQLIKNMVKDKNEADVDAEIDKFAEALRVGQMTYAKSIIANLFHIAA